MSTLTDLDRLADLVAFDSTSGRPMAALAERIAGELRPAGARVEILAGPRDGLVNLLAWAGPGSRDGDGLVLCGHLDVVPADEPGWSGDPFALRRAGDRAVGRGACDMKGFIAVATGRFLAAAAASPGRPLCLLLTCEEETGSHGARHFAETYHGPPLPRSAIIGEPTGLRAVRMHKGHLSMRVTLEGRAAHSGSPQLGRSAIEPAGPILVALADLRRELAGERPDTAVFFPDVPYPVLNVGRITGGGAVNVVPDRCTIDLGVRALPGQDPASLARRVEVAVRAAAPDAVVETINDNPPLLVPADAPLHDAIGRAVDQDQSLGVSFASDGGVLRRRLGMDCVLFGPGCMDVAHRPDEWIDVRELARCADLLDELVRECCA